MDPHCFNGDPDQAFNLIADLDPDPGSQTNADPCGSGSRSDYGHKKLNFFIENKPKVANRSNNKPMKVKNSF